MYVYDSTYFLRAFLNHRNYISLGHTLENKHQNETSEKQKYQKEAATTELFPRNVYHPVPY